MLRGPDSSELEIDLVKIDGWLRKLDTDDALSTPELEFRRLYYTHLRDKIRFYLARCLSRERGDSLPKNPAIDQSNGQGESWKVITPSALFHAVENIRRDFKRRSDAQRNYSEQQCFEHLHPVSAGSDEPSIFQIYFFGCVQELRKLVALAYDRLFALARVQTDAIGSAPVEWARLQVVDLIEHEDRSIIGWIKRACDRQPGFTDGPDTPEGWDEYIFWTDWRAPKWLVMKPNGNVPYDPMMAWERMDEDSTKKTLQYLREYGWILLLEATLEKVAGMAHETVASEAPSSRPQTEPLIKTKPVTGRLKYRSEIKRAILIQFAKKPGATDAEICRGLDADGAMELPEDWRPAPKDRLFIAALSDPKTRHSVEVAISKVRRDLAKKGLDV